MKQARHALALSERAGGLAVVFVNMTYFMLGLGMPNLLAGVNIGLGLWIVVSKPLEIHQQQHQQQTGRAHQPS